MEVKLGICMAISRLLSSNMRLLCLNNKMTLTSLNCFNNTWKLSMIKLAILMKLLSSRFIHTFVRNFVYLLSSLLALPYFFSPKCSSPDIRRTLCIDAVIQQWSFCADSVRWKCIIAIAQLVRYLSAFQTKAKRTSEHKQCQQW